MWETLGMRALPIMLLLAASGALAQAPAKEAASDEANRIVTTIAECLIQGLPDDWQQARMEINLEKPMDDTGAVRYHVLRGEGAEPEAFTPCDPKEPPRAMIAMRKLQSEADRGWIGAQLTGLRDGRFRIRYGYPEKPQQKKK